MKRNLKAQMVGFHHPCILYNDVQRREYYDYLKEADEFSAAAGTYPEERDELIANAAHRYQLLINWMSERLHLNVSFLSKGKIWFNFYADIASRFGLGTQAYTTETRRPHVGVSEISLQDIYLLQLILLHEMQHAIDFCNYSGLQMTISERELRARISICEGLEAIKDTHSKLYAHAIQDLAYWFILLFLTSGIPDSVKIDYYHLLNAETRQLLSSANRGVYFSPLVLRALAKELQRDRITLSSLIRYAIDWNQNGLSLRQIPLTEQETETPALEPDLLETLMLEDEPPQKPFTRPGKNLSKEDLAALTVDYSREVLTTCNRLTDWQSYDEAYKQLKAQARVAIERDTPAFAAVQQRLEEKAPHLLVNSPFAVVPPALETPPETPSQRLARLNMPAPVLETEQASAEEQKSDAIPVHLEPLQNVHFQRHNIEEDDMTLEHRMSELSEFLKERGSR